LPYGGEKSRRQVSKEEEVKQKYRVKYVMLWRGEKKGKAWERSDFLVVSFSATGHAGLARSLVNKMIHQSHNSSCCETSVLVNDFQVFCLVGTNKFRKSESPPFHTD